MKKVISRIITVVLLMQIISFNGAYAARKDTIVSIDDLYDWRRDTAVSVDELYQSNEVDDMYTEFGDTQAVKLYADRYNFSANWALNSEITYNSRKVFSGWESDEVGGNITISGNSLRIADASTSLPVSITKKIEKATYGVLTAYYRTTIKSYSNGFSWTLADGATDVVAICTANNKFYLRQPNDVLVELGAATVDVENGFIIRADIDEKKVEVYLNGVMVATNKDFLNDVDGIDQFSMASSKTATGSFDVPSVSIERGYGIREYFETQTNTTLSALWTNSSSGGTATCIAHAGSPNNDDYNMKFTTTSGSAAATRSFPAETGKTVFEFKQYLSAARNGVSVALRNRNTTVLSINSDNGKFTCVGADTHQFYTYKGNLWYTFRVVLDLPNKKADVYLNGKKKLSNVSLEFGAINNAYFSASTNSTSVEFDDILLYAQDGDYSVPTPTIPAKASSVKLGMQYCPIWREGTSLGWEYVRHYTERVPYLGFYDEGSPEAADWEIKWMAEHGIDFIWDCWYRKGTLLAPIKTTPSSAAIHDGYFYAKNSNKIKFAIMFENSQFTGSTQSELENDFKQNIVPYWIEYFFKDDRYFKINGRPVVGVYNYDRLTEAFNGRSGISSCFDYLTTKCSENGISEPIFILQTFDEGTANFSKYSEAGFDFVYSYHRSDSTPKALKKYLGDIKNNGSINVVTSLPVGYNDRVWQGKQTNSNYGIASVDEYEELCDWANDTYIPSLTSNGLGTNLVMIDTWNEYGEGTYTMPSYLGGFGYLDAIRDAFTVGGAHTDSVPSDESKDRFNNLYPYVTLRAVNDTKDPPVSTQILSQWTFNSGLENWSAKNNISSITTTAGSLKATLSGAEPCIGIDGINIPIREVKYIKLRLKNLTSGNKGRLIFKTADAGYSDFTSINFNIMSSGADYQDIYIPVHSNSLWTGTLTGLKIMPCLSGNALLSGSDKNEFYIDEISLIDGNGSETLHGATILFNGAPIDAANDLIVEDDIPYISASKVQNLLNMIYSYDAETETATFVRDNTKMSMQIDDNKIYYNDSPASFTGGAIMVDGKVYVHYNVFTLFNYIVAYDSAKQMLILRNPWYGNGYDDIIANSYTLTNLTSFGTFEGASPLSNISVNSNVFAQLMSSGAYAGSKALKMVASQANAYSGISVTVKPDTYYCFSAYAKVTSGSTDLTLRSDNLKNTADNHDYVSRTLTGEYTKVSAVFKPIITNEQTIELQFGTSAASTVYIDNIEFYEMPVVYDNAVIGGTFENGGDIDGVVSAYGSTVKEVTTENPIYNNKSLHVTTTGTNGGVAMRAYVIPGERYYLRATVRLIDSTANQVSFALRMHTDSSNWSGGDVVVRKVESVGKAVTLQGYYNAPKVSNNTSYISVAPWEESEYLVDNIEVLHVRNESPEGMVVGELSFYKDYGTASEVKAKNTYLSSGRWTAVLKNFENLAETNQDIAVIMALYKGDELRKIVPIRRNIDEYSYIKEPITASIDVPDLSDGDYYVKGFVFENFSTLTSLARSITVTE